MASIKSIKTHKAAISVKSAKSANGQPAKVKRLARPFVEHPAAPLGDEDRDAFLALLDSDDEPNDALRAAADCFKSDSR